MNHDTAEQSPMPKFSWLAAMARNIESLLRQNAKIEHILSRHFAEVLTKEDRLMDVVKEVSDQVDLTLAVMSNGLAEIQKDLAALANIPIVPDNTAAIEAQIARLKDGTDKLAGGLPAPTPVVSPAVTVAEPVAPAAPAAATVEPGVVADTVVPPAAA